MTTLRDQLANALHKAEDGPDCPYEAKHRETYEPLADAVLALVDVHEEWRTHITAPVHVEGIWLPLPIAEGGAIPDHMTGHVEHRFVLATKPEPVDAEELSR